MLQAKVIELKNSMKSLLQQNQQLKLDLKHGKMKKVFKQEEHMLQGTGKYSANALKVPENTPLQETW